MSGGFSQIDQAVGPDKSKSFKESRRFLERDEVLTFIFFRHDKTQCIWHMLWRLWGF